MANVFKLLVLFNNLTALNNHTEATKLLVDQWGTDEEKETILAIKKRQDKANDISGDDLKNRDDLNRKYHKLLKELS